MPNWITKLSWKAIKRSTLFLAKQPIQSKSISRKLYRKLPVIKWSRSMTLFFAKRKARKTLSAWKAYIEELVQE